MSQGRAVPWCGWEEWTWTGDSLLSDYPSLWLHGIAQVGIACRA